MQKRNRAAVDIIPRTQKERSSVILWNSPAKCRCSSKLVICRCDIAEALPLYSRRVPPQWASTLLSDAVFGFPWAVQWKWLMSAGKKPWPGPAFRVCWRLFGGNVTSESLGSVNLVLRFFLQPHPHANSLTMQIPFEVVVRGVWKNNQHLNVGFNGLLSRESVAIQAV